MPTVFTAREIAETAVEKEMKRRDFYANVTKLSTDPEMTKLFKFLTEEEDRHVATFVKLRDGYTYYDVAGPDTAPVVVLAAVAMRKLNLKPRLRMSSATPSSMTCWFARCASAT